MGSNRPSYHHEGYEVHEKSPETSIPAADVAVGVADAVTVVKRQIQSDLKTSSTRQKEQVETKRTSEVNRKRKLQIETTFRLGGSVTSE